MLAIVNAIGLFINDGHGHIMDEICYPTVLNCCLLLEVLESKPPAQVSDRTSMQAPQARDIAKLIDSRRTGTSADVFLSLLGWSEL